MTRISRYSLSQIYGTSFCSSTDSVCSITTLWVVSKVAYMTFRVVSTQIQWQLRTDAINNHHPREVFSTKRCEQIIQHYGVTLQNGKMALHFSHYNEHYFGMFLTGPSLLSISTGKGSHRHFWRLLSDLCGCRFYVGAFLSSQRTHWPI